MFKKLAQPFLTRRIAFYLFVLSFQAGAINGVAFLHCNRFVTHITGDLTLAGVDLGLGIWMGMVHVLALVVAFISGAMLSAWVIERHLRDEDGSIPRYDLLLLAIFGTLSSCWLLADLGYFGNFRATGPFPWGFLLPLSVASGIQNGLFSVQRGVALRTTHVTGTATDFATNLLRILNHKHTGHEVRMERRLAWLRLGSLMSFFLGAAVSAWLGIHFGFRSLLLPVASSWLVYFMTAYWFFRRKKRGGRLSVPMETAKT